MYDICSTDLNPTLYFAGKSLVTASGTIHTHDASELHFCLSGNASFNFDGEILPITSGDLLIVPRGVPHSSIIESASDPLVLFFAGFSNFQFKGMEPNLIQFPDNQVIYHTQGQVRQDLTNICLHMVAEHYTHQVGQYFMQKTYLIQLLVLIMRQLVKPIPCCKCSAREFDTPHKAYVVSEIQKYLSEHFAEKISLESIARNMYLSAAYISKIFKEETGEAPINYLIQIRLEHAKEQLEQQNFATIKSISDSVGYDDVYYFSKLFKKYYGISPQHYRSSLSQNEMVK